MFRNCYDLVDASGIDLSLSGSDMPEWGCMGMFSDCWYLEAGPELPPDKIAVGCYSMMFYNCLRLQKAPALPSKTLARRCYAYMFENCRELESPPEVSWTAGGTAPNRFSECMFRNCHALTAGLPLNHVSAEEYAYSGIYINCYALSEAPPISL